MVEEINSGDPHRFGQPTDIWVLLKGTPLEVDSSGHITLESVLGKDWETQICGREGSFIFLEYCESSLRQVMEAGVPREGFEQTPEMIAISEGNIDAILTNRHVNPEILSLWKDIRLKLATHPQNNGKYSLYIKGEK